MKALVLSGGGSKGSWQAGALKAISKIHPYGFNLICGTSVGAINGGYLAQYNPEEFPKAVEELINLWNNDLDIWSLKFPPYVAGTWSNSFGSITGLKRLLKEHFSTDRLRASRTELSITAVDIQTGEIKRWTQRDDRIKNAIVASAAFPVFFPTVEIDGSHYTDGGVRDIAPIQAAIDAGADEIVVVLTSDPRPGQEKKLPTNVIEMIGAVIEIMTTDILLNDIDRCTKRAKITLIHPTGPLVDSLNFDKAAMRQQIQIGYMQALLMLDN